MGALTDSIIMLVLDHRVPYLNGDPDVSLLTLPLGNGSLLDKLSDELDACAEGNRRLLVAPCFTPGPSYAEAIAQSSRARVQVITQDRVGELLTDHEATDDVMLVDPRYWPVGGYDLAPFRRLCGEYRGVTHAIAVGADPERAHEWVQQDRSGRVKGVPRFYDRVCWPEVAATRLCLTLVAARLVGPPPLFSTLGELRSLLVARGMLSRDWAIERDVYDLNDADALLALSERALGQTGERGAEFRMSRAGISIGRDCRIHPRARIIPPVVIHSEVTIKRGATVLGPCVIGRGSVIGREAVVAQSLLAPNSIVHRGHVVQERVYHRGDPHNSENALSGGNGHSRPKIEPASVESPTQQPASRLEGGAERPGTRFYEAVTRAANLLLAGIGVALFSPVGVIIALLIKLDSKGPVFFGHVREGRGGRPFRCWKFRTMSADAHSRQRDLYQHNELDGPQFKLDHDPRVTRVGRLLRGTNLDEFPQLLNVLAGEMNLVGPRPSPFRENQICVPWRRARLSVQPGITGLWQICRDRRSGADFHQWIFFDLTYVRNRSLLLDLKILAATVLTGGGRRSVPMNWLITTNETHATRALCYR